MKSKAQIVRLLGLLIAILASNAEASAETGGTHLAATLPSMSPPGSASQAVEKPEVLRVGEPDIFDSSLNPKVSQLGRVAAAFFVDEQRLLMADRTYAEIHLVDLPTGNITTIGRRGDGPGEFRLLMNAMRTTDGFATWDLESRRLIMFSKTGDIVENWVYNPAWFKQPIAEPVALLSNGIVIFRDGENAPNRRGRFRGKTRYLAVTEEGIASVVAEAEGGEYWTSDGTIQSLIFGHLLLEAQVGDQLAIVQTDLGEVRIMDRDGDVARTIPLGQGTKASPEQIEMARDDLRAGLQQRIDRLERRADGGLFVQFRKAQLASVGDIPANKMSPTIDDLFVDLNGRLWLRSYEMPGDDERRWEVWDLRDSSKSKLVVAVPSTATVVDAAGSHVVLHDRDSMGIERVFVAALH